MKTLGLMGLLLLGGGAAAGAQVLAPGNPPLTVEMASKATDYMEWLLDAPFSAEQRERYRQVVVNTWSSGNNGAIQAMLTMSRRRDELPSMTAVDRDALRARMQSSFLPLFRQNQQDPDARWLVAHYDAAHRGGGGAAQRENAERPNPAQTAGDGVLAGRWSTSRISAIQYENRVTGVAAPTNGSSFSWEFKTDGTYVFTGLMQSVVYNCTTSVFSNESGSYAVEGDVISVRPVSNPYQMRYSCAPGSNKEAPGKLIPRSYRFRVVRDGQFTNLELIDIAGGGTSTLRRQ